MNLNIFRFSWLENILISFCCLPLFAGIKKGHINFLILLSTDTDQRLISYGAVFCHLMLSALTRFFVRHTQNGFWGSFLSFPMVRKSFLSPLTKCVSFYIDIQWCYLELQVSSLPFSSKTMARESERTCHFWRLLGNNHNEPFSIFGYETDEKTLSHVRLKKESKIFHILQIERMKNNVKVLTEKIFPHSFA